MVLDKLSKIIADQLGMEQSKITQTTSLKEDLLADSLDIVEIIMSIDAALAFKSVGDVVEYIEKMM